MLVHPKKREPYRMQAPLTPLIDIVFMLLIYFLLTANFIAESGIDVSLPRSEATASRADAEITVYLDANGRIYLEKQPVAFNDLFGRLQGRLRTEPGSMVVVKADRGVDLQAVVNVMDIARNAGAGRLFLATRQAGQGG